MLEITQAAIDAEEALLGAILIESTTSTKDAITGISTMLSISDFYGYGPNAPIERQPQNTRIYHAMLHSKNPPHQIEVVRTMSRLGILQSGDIPYLCHLVAVCPCSLDYPHYAEAVRDYSKARRGDARPVFKGGI